MAYLSPVINNWLQNLHSQSTYMQKREDVMLNGYRACRNGFAILGCLFGFIVGCGGTGEVIVTGELINKTERYKPAAGEQVMICFGEQEAGKTTGNIFPTRLSPDGTFQIIGANDHGIKPGKYRVSISSVPEVPVPGQPIVDKFQNAFGMENSPIYLEVSAANRNVKVVMP